MRVYRRRVASGSQYGLDWTGPSAQARALAREPAVYCPLTERVEACRARGPRAQPAALFPLQEGNDQPDVRYVEGDTKSRAENPSSQDVRTHVTLLMSK